MLNKPFYFDDDVWGADTWPLLSAAYTGDVDVVKQILDADPTMIRVQFAYYEPLHYAVRGGSLQMVKLLLERGAHPKAAGWNHLGDETPIRKALDRNLVDIAKLLMDAAGQMSEYVWAEEKEKSPEQQLQVDFDIACGFTPDLRLVEKTLTSRPLWATRGLYEAVHHNRIEIANLLFDAGANVFGSMPYACWFTPLMHALRYPQPRWEMAELLFEKEVAVNGVNGLGASALHMIVLQGTSEAVYWLLDHGADINYIEPEFCSTPLGWAARWGRTAMAKLLLERGADERLAGAEWSTPMYWALHKGHAAIVELYLR